MPVQAVSAPIHSVKVADNRPNTTYARSTSSEMPVADAALVASGSAYSDVYLDFPHSSPFVAQLFGQLDMEGGEQASFFVDYEMLTKFEEIKYKPSFAFRPHESLMANLAERQKVFLAEQPPESTSVRDVLAQGTPQEATDAQTQPAREWGNPSLYSEGVSAYTAQESRSVMEFSPVQDTERKPLSAMI